MNIKDEANNPLTIMWVTLLLVALILLVFVIINEINNGKERELWNIADKCGTEECYQIYLDKYPNGEFSELPSLILNHKD